MRSLAAAAVVLVGVLACSAPQREVGLSLPAPRDDEAARLRAAYRQPPAAWPAPHVDAGIAYVELGPAPAPVPLQDDRARAQVLLGQTLFFDPRLSGSGQVACATCHDPDLGFADGRTTSFGHGRTSLRRNAPTIQNAARSPLQFWDGRAASLDEQALMVFENQDEMHSSGDHVVALLRQSPGYGALFAAAYGEEDPTLERALSAIAAFEATVQSDRSSAFDRFLLGDDGALSDAAVRGLHLFRTKARCVNCHHGPLLTDHGFHDLGLSYYGRALEDLGRYRVTGDPADVGRFKTPSLRNVERTAPYMHNGLFDLDGVVNMYSAGMATLRRKPEQQDDPLFPTKSPLLQKLDLDAQEKQDLLAFLRSLTERRRRLRPPPLPELAASTGDGDGGR